uniref:Aspartate/glutamate/uridylate kinase domain-containing protein n=1 Tax=Chlamydomonas euryale TaxID=1486919 RepID=A0A7R9VL17_9CHLO
MHQPIPTSSGNHYRESPAATRSPSPGLRHHYMRPAASSSNIKELVGFQGQIIVLKVGTSSLVDPEQSRFNLSAFARIVETVKRLHEMGHYVILISSGAVAMGCHRLNLELRPHDLAKKQALAAIGQGHLMKFWEDFLHSVGLTCAQVLVTLENVSVRGQYLNVRNTFTELLAYGVVPIVNENDCISVAELKFGDNDTLAAHVAALVNANWLFLMTDVDHLYTANPKTNPDAEPIYEVRDITSLDVDTSEGEGSQWGTGGMATKLTAARIGTAAGVTVVIMSAAAPELVMDAICATPAAAAATPADAEMQPQLRGRRGASLGSCGAAARVGTTFLPIAGATKGRKRWILSVPVRGALVLKPGVADAVSGDTFESVSWSQVLHVDGDFFPHDAVRLVDGCSGAAFARALVSVSAKELRATLESGHWARDDFELDAEVVPTDNIVMLAAARGSRLGGGGGGSGEASPRRARRASSSASDTASGGLPGDAAADDDAAATGEAVAAAAAAAAVHVCLHGDDAAAADVAELLLPCADLHLEFLETRAKRSDAERLKQKMLEMHLTADAAPQIASVAVAVHDAEEAHASERDGCAMLSHAAAKLLARMSARAAHHHGGNRGPSIPVAGGRRTSARQPAMALPV